MRNRSGGNSSHPEPLGAAVTGKDSSALSRMRYERQFEETSSNMTSSTLFSAKSKHASTTGRCCSWVITSPNIVKLKDSSKNSVHDGIKFFSSCGLSFVKFVKQIIDLSRARYSAHFDTKLSSIIDCKVNRIAPLFYNCLALVIKVQNDSRIVISSVILPLKHNPKTGQKTKNLWSTETISDSKLTKK
ncbi:hypothetical protein T03_8864 [Trichinella britovi]|uniref:Uncharacterized protein n=1 Tax=Trichinella britovi TaxID=45882 RepID=A0A0V1D6W4_TRIBR|nr:hypothetical protein T03_8864 [Trichinella britovi]